MCPNRDFFQTSNMKPTYPHMKNEKIKKIRFCFILELWPILGRYLAISGSQPKINIFYRFFGLFPLKSDGEQD